MQFINKDRSLSLLVKGIVETWILPSEIDMLVIDSDYHACGSPSYAFPVRASEIMRQHTLFGPAVIMFY